MFWLLVIICGTGLGRVLGQLETWLGMLAGAHLFFKLDERILK